MIYLHLHRSVDLFVDKGHSILVKGHFICPKLGIFRDYTFQFVSESYMQLVVVFTKALFPCLQI